ncbi:DUF3137 domain-containing protein [Sphingosinicella sp. CPCC 101087]|uniref:DUF3137 domain-containing protein n=1 Tax=Sphingosinicella sp. CPCC 101087 TaxID=2497754 RepID=UPI00101CCF70|nr:DUF3137 domain-containing protein [Sphingosinicella sp. CPCC 101087]
MIELDARAFEHLCRTGVVRTQLDTLDERRRRSIRHFWFHLVGSLVLAAVVLISLAGYGWLISGIILAGLVVIVGLFFAFRPLGAVKAELKHPVLETLAGQNGMEYLPDGFDPPVFPEASQSLFGGITSYGFTDLFHGTDKDRKRFAFYEGKLVRGSGKNAKTLFSGQFYAFQRRSPGNGETAIVPDKGLFNFSKPSGFQRIGFDGDPAFESCFEVYTNEPAASLVLLEADARRTLLDLRAGGKTFVYVGPEDVLVGIWGKNRFEPGSMFSARPGEQRVKEMFEEVRAALSVIRTLKAALD